MTDENTHPHLTWRHEVRMRLPEGRRLLALSLMAKEIARGKHVWWNSGGYTIFAFATPDLRNRFETLAVGVVNGPELSWDEIVVRVDKVRLAG